MRYLYTEDLWYAGESNTSLWTDNSTPVSPPNVELEPGQAWRWNPSRGEWVAETKPVPTTPYMTHFGFLSRFTPAERLAIRDRTDKTSPNYDPVLDDAMFLFNQAERIDVTLDLTQQLVGYMAQIGLIQAADVPARLAPIDINSPHAKP